MSGVSPPAGDSKRDRDQNIRIYRRSYTPESLRFGPFGTSYDREMVRLRFRLLRGLVEGKRVLDLGCGPGSYLLPLLPRVERGIGIDVVSEYLQRCERDCPASCRDRLRVALGRAEAIPLMDGSVECAYSFATLYYVPELAEALREISRVLCVGGVAVLELGNLWSLNTYMASRQHRLAGWAKPHHVAYPALIAQLRDAGLAVERHRGFQLLPMYGGPRWLAPLVSTRWKSLAGVRVGGRMLDEWVSSAPPLRWLAFRHLVVCRKSAGSQDGDGNPR